MRRAHLRALAWFLLLVAIYYWKFLFTRQFSLLAGFENANQAFSWYTFIARSLKEGNWPIWDPYTFSGHSFVGEMQTAAFFPLNLILAAVPFNRNGVLSPALYHYLYAVAHVLGAYFMFCLVRTFGLSFPACVLSGICFSLGGFVGRLGGWPHLYWSAIWLPLIILLLIKAIGAEYPRSVIYAALSGLVLGLVTLAGGLHVVIMDVIVMITVAATCVAFANEEVKIRPWKRGCLVLGIALVVAAGSSAIQWLPSMEYSSLALRYVGDGALLASEKIPYHRLSGSLYPIAITALLFPFNPGIFSGESNNLYIGVFPVLLAAIGIRKKWHVLWVRYLTGLWVAAFAYSLASFSLLHGLLYAIVPKLWLVREAGRFAYMAGFALAILAGYGWTSLVEDPGTGGWGPLQKILRWTTIFAVLALTIAALYGKPDPGAWNALSLLLIISACSLTLFIMSGHRARSVVFLAFALILFDLHAFDWSAVETAPLAAHGDDELQRLLSFANAAKFLKSQPGLFRVQLDVKPTMNVGDLYGIPATFGGGATIAVAYDRTKGISDLFNVRYVVKPASATEPGPVYQDRRWKIFVRPTGFPRAWLVHDVAIEPSADAAVGRLKSPGFDAKAIALVSKPLDTTLEAVPEGSDESVAVTRNEPHRIELLARTEGRGLVVMSENFYPGWRAEVNGAPAEVRQVDVALRGVVVPRGESRIVCHYAPASVRAGSILSAASFCIVFAGIWWYRRELFGVERAPDQRT